MFEISNFCSVFFCIAKTIIIIICWEALESTPSEKAGNILNNISGLSAFLHFFQIVGSALLLPRFLFSYTYNTETFKLR